MSIAIEFETVRSGICKVKRNGRTIGFIKRSRSAWRGDPWWSYSPNRGGYNFPLAGAPTLKMAKRKLSRDLGAYNREESRQECLTNSPCCRLNYSHNRCQDPVS